MTARRTRTAARLLLAAALALGAACQDRPATTAPVIAAADPQAAKSNGGAARLTELTLASETVVIGGPGTRYDVTIRNRKQATLTGVSLRAEVRQGTVGRDAGERQVNCGGGAGVLPPGSCTMSLSLDAPGDAVGGQLVPGAAELALRLLGDDGATQFDIRFAGITLVAPPRIASWDLGTTFAVLDGDAGTKSVVTVTNPSGIGVPDVRLRGYVVQGTAERAAGEVIANCPAADGVLPPGDSAMSVTLMTTNSSPGTGTLATGPATFRLELLGDGGGTVFDTRTVDVTLVTGPVISELVLSSTNVVLNGPGTPYQATVVNPFETTLTGAGLQGQIVQGATVVPAGGVVANCPAADGILPPGTCTMTFTVNASTADLGTGILVPGAATFRLELWHGGAVIATRTAAITLVNP